MPKDVCAYLGNNPPDPDWQDEGAYIVRYVKYNDLQVHQLRVRTLERAQSAFNMYKGDPAICSLQLWDEDRIVVVFRREGPIDYTAPAAKTPAPETPKSMSSTMWLMAGILVVGLWWMARKS